MPLVVLKVLREPVQAHRPIASQQAPAMEALALEEKRIIEGSCRIANLIGFYENLPPAEAFALARRFAFYYTPKRGSWLNMIEIES